MDHLTSANWYTNCNGFDEFLGGTQQFPSMEQGSVDTRRQFTAPEHVQYTTLVPSGGTQYVEEPDVYAPMITQQSTKESLPLQESRLHHRRPTGGEKILCPECGATFACLANLRNHLRIHTGERPYVCEECGSSFTQRSNLRSHKRVHTGERPYMCGYCGQTFARSSHLPGHIRTHTGEKPFTCPQCSRSFATNQIMKNHMRTHTGERPFVCEICEATFAQSSCLATHKKIHTGERKFKCGECGKAFISRSGLQTHERVHTGEKPYKCEKCTKSFKTSSYLSKHKQKYCGNSSFKKRVRKPDDKKLAQRPAGNRKMGNSRKTVKNSGKPPKTNKTKRLRHPKRHCNNESEAEVKAKENIFLKPILEKSLRDADYSHMKQEEGSLDAVGSHRSTEPLSILGLSSAQEYSKLTKEGSFLMSCIKTEYHIVSGTNEVKDLLGTNVYGETQCELQEAYPQVIDIQHQVGVDSILKEAHCHSIPESIVCPQDMTSRGELGTHSQAMQALPPVSSISMPTVALQQAYL